jgi:hypothetical protein
MASPAPGDIAALHTRRSAAEYAILIAPSEGGWRWQVIDRNAVSVADGLSADQGDAMACAQRAIEFCA